MHLMVFVLAGRLVRSTIGKVRSRRLGLRPSGMQLVSLLEIVLVLSKNQQWSQLRLSAQVRLEVLEVLTVDR